MRVVVTSSVGAVVQFSSGYRKVLALETFAFHYCFSGFFMSEHSVFSVPYDIDLRPLSAYLWRMGMPHRITEAGDQQVVWARTAEEAECIRLVYEDFRAGKLRPLPPKPQLKVVVHAREEPLLAVIRSPLTVSLMVLSVLGYLLVLLDPQMKYVHLFTFFEFARYGNQIYFAWPQGDYWRMITPIFLHFSLMHIIFNMLWLWDLGRRIEQLQGTWHLLGIVISMAMGSNIIQFLFAGAGIFGGMSGVIYGLLGYCWSWSKLHPDTDLHVPVPVMVVMMIWLVLCLVGFATLLGAGEVANAAHVGGLIMGLILGTAAGLVASSAKKAG
jgi:GlpG protein